MKKVCIKELGDKEFVDKEFVDKEFVGKEFVDEEFVGKEFVDEKFIVMSLSKRRSKTTGWEWNKLWLGAVS